MLMKMPIVVFVSLPWCCHSNDSFPATPPTLYSLHSFFFRSQRRVPSRWRQQPAPCPVRDSRRRICGRSSKRRSQPSSSSSTSSPSRWRKWAEIWGSYPHPSIRCLEFLAVPAVTYCCLIRMSRMQCRAWEVTVCMQRTLTNVVLTY